MEPREYTLNEVRSKFIEAVNNLVELHTVAKSDKKTALHTLAGDILLLIDGGLGEIPTFLLAPLPHEDDKTYYKEIGKNYYPENLEKNINCNISGFLQQEFLESGI